MTLLNIYYSTAMWIAAHPTAVLIIACGYLLFYLFSIWTCLTQTEGIDRLTWLCLILAVPIFGIIFFWLLFNKSDDKFSDLLIHRTPASASPQTKRESSIAEAVNASIAESVRNRK
jgi:cytosine/uracil/thiamine/allantoin permease